MHKDWEYMLQSLMMLHDMRMALGRARIESTGTSSFCPKPGILVSLQVLQNFIFSQTFAKGRQYARIIQVHANLFSPLLGPEGS